MESQGSSQPQLRPVHSPGGSGELARADAAPIEPPATDLASGSFRGDEPVDTFDPVASAVSVDDFYQGLGLSPISGTLDEETLRSVAQYVEEVEGWSPAMADVFAGALSLASFRTPPRSNRVL